MAGRFLVTEYVPRSVVWAKRACKWVLLGCMAAVMVLFFRQLLTAEELRERCGRFEDAVIRYGKLTEEGDAACEAGDMRFAEQCYLTALQIDRVSPGPYLKLAQIYREYRRYDLALWILEEYQGEDGEISAEAEKMKRLIGQLEVSEFREMAE